MAPARAVAWPAEIYDDPDVLSLDERGGFIICRVCIESFAVYGGKTPKPISMNACFRTRAWETHKRRTRAHRRQRATASCAITKDPTVEPLESSNTKQDLLCDLRQPRMAEQDSGPIDFRQHRDGDSIAREAAAVQTSHALALDHILNPVDEDDWTDSDANIDICCVVNNRRPRQADTAAHWISTRSRRATHDLYWKTVRELFSPARPSERRTQSQAGD